MKFLALLLTLCAALPLAACSEEDDKSAASDIPASEEFNQADVDFATHMIQQHAQALLMADLTDGRDLPVALVAVVEQIRMTQGVEIETMVDWLNAWNQPIPETVRDHANAHAHGDGEAGMDSDLPGMVSAEEMERLEAAAGEEFEQMWLELMIEHHEGAIEMATTEKSAGEYPDATDLAKSIIEAQQAEIEEMEALRDS